MNFKELAKGVVARNGKVNDAFYRAFSTHRNELIELSESMSTIDTIEDTSSLIELKHEIEKGRPWYCTDANVSNCLIYGIWHNLFGACQNGDVIDFPAVEHGLILHDKMFTDTKFTGRCSLVSFGDYRYSVLRHYTDKPVFKVGPYIEYASQYYDDERIKKIKNDWGKTLLVFPSHSTNDTSITLAESEYIEAVSRMSLDFNTTVICAYWWNIDDPLIDAFRSNGFRISSAGFRDDVQFLSRLKTLLTLSDCVIGDGFGTHVGYSLAIGRPYATVSVSQNHVKSGKSPEGVLVDGMELQDRLSSIISSDFYSVDMLKTLLDPYFGFSYTRTRAELNQIAEISHDLSALSGRRASKIKSSCTKLLNNYREMSDDRWRLLREGIEEASDRSYLGFVRNISM